RCGLQGARAVQAGGSGRADPLPDADLRPRQRAVLAGPVAPALRRAPGLEEDRALLLRGGIRPALRAAFPRNTRPARVRLARRDAGPLRERLEVPGRDPASAGRAPGSGAGPPG